MTMQGYIKGNTVVVEDSAINSYDGYKVEIKILEKKPMTYREACEELRKFEGSGIWEGNHHQKVQ